MILYRLEAELSTKFNHHFLDVNPNNDPVGFSKIHLPDEFVLDIGGEGIIVEFLWGKLDRNMFRLIYEMLCLQKKTQKKNQLQ